MKVAVEAGWELPEPTDEPPLQGAVLETRDYWDHRTREWPDRDGWRAVGCDHRAAHPNSGAAVCRRLPDGPPAGPYRVWMLDVPDLEALTRLMAEGEPCQLRVEWCLDPNGRALLLHFDEHDD